jgi:excisionase family DNA binding protein
MNSDSSSLKNEIDVWLTTSEAAEFLKIPKGTLRNLTSNGKIPYYKVPGTRLNRYRQSELQELLLLGKKGGV